jgi:transposase
VIPSKANRGEPIEHDAEVCRQRNQVERLVNKVKPFRRIPARYEHLDATFLATFHLVAAFVAIR